MEVRALRESEQQGCLDLWCTVFTGQSRAYFSRYFYGDTEWLPYYTQAAVHNGKIVSAVHIVRRTVACGDFRLTMGGIANVATLPEYRRQGINSLCLDAAIHIMEADAMDFSLLFTGIHDYYARKGYSVLAQRQLQGNLKSNPDSRTHRFSVVPLPPDAVGSIAECYAAYNSQRPIAVQRTAAYWRDWIGGRPGATQNAPFGAIDSVGKLVGYALVSVHGRRANVYEFGFNASEEADEREIAAALFAAIGSWARDSGASVICVSGPQSEGIRQALEGIAQNLEELVTSSAMIRLLNRDNLLRSFLLELNARRHNNRVEGRAAFETPYGAIRLDGTKPFLRVDTMEDEQSEHDELPAVGGSECAAFSQSDLFGLLFGTQSPQRLSTDDSTREFLTTLFPVRDAVYWSEDGF